MLIEIDEVIPSLSSVSRDWTIYARKRFPIRLLIKNSMVCILFQIDSWTPSSPAFVGFFVYRHFSLHSIDGIRMSKRKHIEKIDERVDR